MIYCKFWELDTDHDFLIDKDDLLRYGNHALTYRVVERIFSQVFVLIEQWRHFHFHFEVRDFVWIVFLAILPDDRRLFSISTSSNLSSWQSAFSFTGT